MSVPDDDFPEEFLVPLLGEKPLITLFIGSSDEEPGEQGLFSWLVMGDEVQSARLFAYSEALIEERDYVYGLLGFDEVTAPVRDAQIPADLQELADLLEIDRVVFLMVMTTSGKMAAVRDYTEVEMTLLENLHAEMTEFLNILAHQGGWGKKCGHA